MKKVIATLIVLVSISAGAIAQGRGGQGERMNPEQRAEFQTKRMTEQLELTEEQQKKVLALNVERNKTAMESGRDEASKRQEAREAYVKELNSILTPEQQEKLKSASNEGRGQRDGSRGGQQQGRRPSRPQN